jgi:hypothetical protein
MAKELKDLLSQFPEQSLTMAWNNALPQLKH